MSWLDIAVRLGLVVQSVFFVWAMIWLTGVFKTWIAYRWKSRMMALKGYVPQRTPRQIIPDLMVSDAALDSWYELVDMTEHSADPRIILGTCVVHMRTVLRMNAEAQDAGRTLQ